MKKLAVFLLTVALLLLVSCNASILMTNGEILKPENTEGNVKEEKVEFSYSPSSLVSATRSYYKDAIVVRWSEVDGADYYTIERCQNSVPSLPSFPEWKEIPETVEGLQYRDTSELERGVYYFYRVKAHTYEGKVGGESSPTIGTILSSPIEIQASKGDSTTTIFIQWKEMPYVESYRIYRSSLPTVNGVESEYVATVRSSSSGEMVYSYMIDEKEKGKELYFAIEAMGPLGSGAGVSLPRSGYTFVPGAPSAPSVNYITKGDDTSSISISFFTPGSDVSYVIKRSSPGSAESIVFSEEYGSVLPPLGEDGFYTFVDSDVKSGVVYSYSVMAYNSIGSSQATTVEGYLLSPVRNVHLSPLRGSDGSIGYSLSFTEPAGSGDASRDEKMEYVITAFNKKGETMEIDGSPFLTEEEGKIYSVFFPVSWSVDRKSEKNEISYVTIKTVKGETESSEEMSNVIPMLPEPILSITGSRNALPLDGEKANSSGVYPVHISWVSSFDGERILNRVGSDGSNKAITISNGLSYTDTTGEPMVVYDYYFDTSDEFGRSLGEEKRSGDAYGAIDPNVFASIIDSVSVKPFQIQTYVPEIYKDYWKKCRIATMVEYGNASDLSTQMKALGSAEDYDHYRRGKISYNAEMEGVGGAIYFTYSSFGENPQVYLTGSYEMHVNASGTGSASSSTGGLKVEGMYPALISLEKVSVSKKALVGSYVITLTYDGGKSRTYEVAL